MNYTARVITDEGKERFKSFLTNVNGETLLGNNPCPDTNTPLLYKKINDLNRIRFPLKSRRIRSSDKPWITDNIRRKIKRRKREFFSNDHTRTERWHSLKKESHEPIRMSKLKYYSKEAEKMMAPGSNSVPFKSLHHIYDGDAPPKWTINQLTPDMSDLKLAEDLARYFTRISDGFVPLGTNQLPTTYVAPFPILAPMKLPSGSAQPRSLALWSTETSCRAW